MSMFVLDLQRAKPSCSLGRREENSLIDSSKAANQSCRPSRGLQMGKSELMYLYAPKPLKNIPYTRDLV